MWRCDNILVHLKEFGPYPLTFVNDHGLHFINVTIEIITNLFCLGIPHLQHITYRLIAKLNSPTRWLDQINQWKEIKLGWTYAYCPLCLSNSFQNNRKAYTFWIGIWISPHHANQIFTSHKNSYPRILHQPRFWPVVGLNWNDLRKQGKMQLKLLVNTIGTTCFGLNNIRKIKPSPSQIMSYGFPRQVQKTLVWSLSHSILPTK